MSGQGPARTFKRLTRAAAPERTKHSGHRPKALTGFASFPV